QALRVREHPRGSIGGHNHRGRSSIEHMRADGRLAIRIKHDPERISTFCKLGLDGEFRIVRQDGPEAHENRVDLRAQLMDAPYVFVVSQPNGLSIRESNHHFDDYSQVDHETRDYTRA